MDKKSFFYIMLCILVLITCNIVSAEDASSFKVSLNPVTSSISVYGQAVYEMKITNMNPVDDKFRIYYSDVMWDFHTEPRTDSSVTIGAYETKKITLVFKPNNLALGTYAVPINVRGQKDNVLQSVSAFISIRSPDQLTDTYYNTAINMDLSMDDKIDPRKEILINVDLTNLNPKNNTGLVVVIESDMFRDQKYTSLAPMEKKRIIFKQSIGPLEKPERHFVDAYILMEQPNNKTILVAKIDKPKVFDVVEYGSLAKNESLSKGFLKSIDTIIVKNDGNLRKDEILKVETGLIKRLFQKTSPEATELKEEGKRYYAFEIGLEPSQSATITVTTNYRILLWIFIIIVLCIVLYFALRSPIVITKSYSNVTLKEGGISELKVMIHLKNRSIKARDNVVIIDLVPHIAEVEKDFPVGSLHPTSIFRHEKKGTVVKWNLDSLDGFEERIITYNIKSRLSILGGFKLPVAKAKFRQFGRTRVAKSNKVFSRV